MVRKWLVHRKGIARRIVYLKMVYGPDKRLNFMKKLAELENANHTRARFPGKRTMSGCARINLVAHYFEFHR